MKKEVISENYLEKIPLIKDSTVWNEGEDGKVTLEIENKGFVNRLAQKLIRKPKTSYIHLDETGDFVWRLIDGKKDIIQIGTAVSERFGEKAEPLYERLAQYFKTLEAYGFVDMLEKP